MTAKELITILKRFPKDAIILVNGVPNPDFNATCDTDEHWALNLIAAASIVVDDEQENSK